MQRSVSLAAIVVGLGLLGSVVRAEKDGVDSAAYFPPIGCGGAGGLELGCHLNEADPELTVTITGPKLLEPGGFGVYEASIPDDFARCVAPDFDHACAGAGINVQIGGQSSTACDLDTLAAGNLHLEPSPSSIGGFVITHNDAESPAPQGNIGVYRYTFLLTNCGVPGNIVLLAAMNAFDRSGDETGEAWNEASLQIVVPEPAGTGAAAGAALVAGALARRRSRRG